MSWIIPAVGVGLSLYDRFADDGDDSGSTSTTKTPAPMTPAQTAMERKMYYDLYGDYSPWSGQQSKINEVHNRVISKLPQFKGITTDSPEWNNYMNSMLQEGGWDANEENKYNIGFWRDVANNPTVNETEESNSQIAELMKAVNVEKGNALRKYAGVVDSQPSVGIGFGGQPMWNLTPGVPRGNKELMSGGLRAEAGTKYPASLGELMGSMDSRTQDQYLDTRKQSYLNYLANQQSGQGTTTQTANLPQRNEDWMAWAKIALELKKLWPDTTVDTTKTTVAEGAADSGYDATTETGGDITYT